MTPTLRDVARVAGVSFKTVSNVVNGHPHVAEATRLRVLAAIEQLGYRPNLFARTLRSGRTGAIGLAVPELGLAYFAQLADEVIEVANEHDLVVLIETTGGDRRRELEVLGGHRRRLTDGLLFSPVGLGLEDAAALEREYPLVLLGERVFDAPVDHVTMQNVDGARAATELLLDQGRRRIAVLGERRSETLGPSALRIEGYRAALESRGVHVDESLIVETGSWRRADGAEAMRGLLDRGVAFDAVFALNDELALGAMRALREHGVEVPAEVAIIGFDDLDEGRYALPSLSTVDPGRREIARLAVALLLERLAPDGAGAPPRRLQSRHRIVERESTART